MIMIIDNVSWDTTCKDCRRVMMCCRSLEKGNFAREVIQKRDIDISKLFLIQLDLADLDNVDSFRELLTTL